VNNLASINNAKAYLGLAPENLNVLKTADTENGIVKIDHELTAKHRLSFRYNIEHARDLNQLLGSTLDGGGIGAPGKHRTAAIRAAAL
jgi:hypothetical protein